ncbi:MAG: glycoside hydrolase family 3 C-terminal domain-containing protein [Prevotellaceae bacterium]|nr:glycoside hydrolase family 3 C-terminal domain-containing protein [Candidatus Minthosoma caballi]
MKKTFTFLFALLLAQSCIYAQQSNPLLQHETEITDIIKSMTLEEKVNMLHGKNMFSSAGIERLGIADIEYADGPFGIREEMEPHSWNSLKWETDKATFFPTGSALAATWSKDIAYQYGKAMAIEARLRGKDMILGPAINIQRIPTGGRTYEYLSEDPILSGQLAVGYTLGAQDNKEAVCLKHFALNNQENMRGFVNVNVTERAMREIYLIPFEMAVRDANAYGVMAAYNKVWGRWCSENDNLQNRILRNEWGFRGIIISDWGGTHSTVGAAVGGLDVEMPGNTYMGQALIDSVRSGAVPMEVIDAKVRNLLRVRMAIPAVPKSEANKQVTSQPAQQKIAYEVASKSIVLLKNADNLLPISKKVKTIAVIGDNATRKMAQGGVGAGVKALYEITPLEGLQTALKGKAKVIFAQGYEPKPRARRGQTVNTEEWEKKAEVLKTEAVAAAKKADMVIFVGGDNREVETEGSDRKDINMPFGQEELVEALAAVNPNIVAVMVAGAPVDLRKVNPAVKSLVYSWFNGSEGGHALADILTGKIAPSGKLPFTLPEKLEDSPAYALGVFPQKEQAGSSDVFVDLVNKDKFRAERNAEADYSEGILVGYRWFTTKNVKPMYPFGYGMSYVPFNYADAKAEINGTNLDVTFKLTNAGKMEADEVAQVYIARPDSKVERPKYELKGFKRVAIKAGATENVTISIPIQHLRHWNEFQHAWNVETGKAIIYVGSSSENLPLQTTIEICNSPQ